MKTGTEETQLKNSNKPGVTKKMSKKFKSRALERTMLLKN